MNLSYAITISTTGTFRELNANVLRVVLHEQYFRAGPLVSD